MGVPTQSYAVANQYPHLPFGTDRAPNDSAPQQQRPLGTMPQAQANVLPSMAQPSATEIIITETVAAASATPPVPQVTVPSGQMLATGPRASFVAVPSMAPPQVSKPEQSAPGL